MAKRLFALMSLLGAIAGCGHRTDDGLRDDGVRKPKVKDESIDDSDDSDAELLEALLGDWVSKSTGRALHALRGKDRKSVEFQVVDEGEFNGQYSARETRFKVRIGAAKTYVVTDYYRPVPPTGYTYSSAAYASCRGTFTKDERGHLLTGRFVGPDVFEVTFALVNTALGRGPSPLKELTDCRHEVVDVMKIGLARKLP